MKLVAFAIVSMFASCAFAAPAPVATDRPNIIFILADDIGITGISSYGADEFKTPNIDALAAGGTRFARCFSAPICGPSRALALTGRYAFRTGVYGNGSAVKLHPSNEITVAKTLHNAGYATAAAGKWSQLSHLESRDDGKAWGFDEFMLWIGSGPDPENSRYWKPRFNHNGQSVQWKPQDYGPDVLLKFVVDFAARHKDKPFFIYYPNPLPHAPREATPDSKPGVAGRDVIRDQITYLDKQVGQLVTELEKLGLREKTLIVFAGDNGTPGGGTIAGRAIDGGKGTFTEGASRVPLIASRPGRVPAGVVNDDLVDFSDLLPTFCEVAGAPLPADRTIDGRSFAPQLAGKVGTPREWVYVNYEKGQEGKFEYVRDNDYRLTRDGKLTKTTAAPFGDTPTESTDPAASGARQRLQAVLDKMKE